jgi:L-ascorbate metabolism protein UlaG (beta-lactamase superfamily)
MSGNGVTYVGQATTLIEVDGMRLLTDPVLLRRIGHIRRISPPPSADLHVDAVLISHAHHDHLHLRLLRRLRRTFRWWHRPGRRGSFGAGPGAGS